MEEDRFLPKTLCNQRLYSESKLVSVSQALLKKAHNGPHDTGVITEILNGFHQPESTPATWLDGSRPACHHSNLSLHDTSFHSTFAFLSNIGEVHMRGF